MNTKLHCIYAKFVMRGGVLVWINNGLNKEIFYINKKSRHK
jgi:hypothetical protein